MDFNQVCEHVAQYLPERWRITIDLEKGAGTITLYSPTDGEIDETEYAPYEHKFEDKLLEAVAYARSKEVKV